MDRTQFWKTFTLGSELNIAGRFIYNASESFHELSTFSHTDEIFEILYFFSVGFERLLKVAVVLIEHDDTIDQVEFKTSLITHSHLDLLHRVSSKHDLKLAGIHNEFLQILGSFYKTHRYGRYGTGTLMVDVNERTLLCDFISKYLNVALHDENPLDVAQNSPRFKKFIGKTAGRIACELYKIIYSESKRLNIYTSELRSDSKAAKIFLSKKYDFADEEVLTRELLLFFITSDRTDGHIGYMKGLKALAFDEELEAEYIQCLASNEKKLQVMDELEALYDEVDDVGTRLSAISVIGKGIVAYSAVGNIA